MRTRLPPTLAAIFLIATAAAQAGGWCGPRWGGYDWGGGCGPRWGGWGGPAFGISFVAPVPVYRTVYVTRPAAVYVAQPAPVYVQRVVTARVSGTLVRAQAQLASLGYYAGAVDGVFGLLTSRAIVRYQADYGLPVTGRLDRATLRSLGT